MRAPWSPSFLSLAIVPLAAAVCGHAQPVPLEEAGRQLYMGSCTGCHGATGEGSQGPSLLSGRVSRMPDRTLFETIRNGLPGTTMPNFPMADARIHELVAFVRSLSAPAASVAAVPGGDPSRGRAFFLGAGRCNACHMIRGEGGSLGPDLSNIGADRTLHQLRESLTKPSARIAAGYSAVTATTADGRRIDGVAKNYNSYSAQILDRAGKLHLLRRADLKSLDVKEASLMPAVADAAAVNDLLAFLTRQTMRPYTAAEGKTN